MKQDLGEKMKQEVDESTTGENNNSKAIRYCSLQNCSNVTNCDADEEMHIFQVVNGTCVSAMPLTLI